MLLVVLGGIFGVSIFLEDYTKHDEFIEVPAFEGFHYSEIGAFISDKGLRFEITDSIFNPNEPKGIVLEQIPMAGDFVKPNRKVYLTINSVVPPSIVLPELRDITVRQVVSKIETYGLKVDSLIYKPAECDNCVIGVLHNGEEVLPGTRIEKGSSLSLVIGEGIGSEKLPIPYLYKHTLAEIRAALNSHGLNVGYYEFDTSIYSREDSINAFVFRQTPSYDTTKMVRQGQAFELFFTLDSNKVEGMELVIGDTTKVETNE
jgi:beta-lactam-binding protein with PASTA domain